MLLGDMMPPMPHSTAWRMDTSLAKPSKTCCAEPVASWDMSSTQMKEGGALGYPTQKEATRRLRRVRARATESARPTRMDLLTMT
eukprot:4232861-Alexandrium_andersonii.AAC.1